VEDLVDSGRFKVKVLEIMVLGLVHRLGRCCQGLPSYLAMIGSRQKSCRHSI
jgi:hypothetical protein